MKIAKDFNANNYKIVNLTSAVATTDAVTLGQLQTVNAITPSGGTFAVTGAITTSTKAVFPSIQLTTGASANYVLQSDASGNASWVSPASSSGGWTSGTYGYQSPVVGGQVGQVGVVAAALQNVELNIGGTLPLVSGAGSQGLRVNSTLNPDTSQNAYGINIIYTVNAGTGLTVGNAAGLMVQVTSKTGTGTIPNSYAIYSSLSTIGSTLNYGLYVDGSVGNGPGTVSQVIKLGSSQTGDMLQFLDNSSTLLTNVNQYGNIGVGINNSYKRVRFFTSGTIDGVAEASNTHGILSNPTHITNPGSSSYGFYLQDTVQVASGTNSNYYAAYVLGAVKSGAGTYATSYGLYVSASSFATNNYAATFMGGNVGIGTTAPAYTLDVSGPIQSSYSINKGTLNRGYNFTTSLTNPATITVLDVSSAGGAGGALQIGANNQVWAAIHGYYTDGSGNGRGNIVLSTRRGAADATLTPAMVVGGTSGYVGIGTTAPAYTLDITGNVNINGTGYVPSSNKLIFWDTTGNHSIGSISSGYMQIRDYYGISLISTAYNSTINFTGVWLSTVSTTTAEISNDQGTYQALMIAGNTSSGTRKVNLYDNVLVNGTLGVNSTLTAGSTLNIGSNAVLISSQTKYGFQNDPSNYFIQYHDTQQQMYFNSYYGRFAFRNGAGGIGQIRIDTTSTANSLYITTNNYQGYGGNNTAEISNDTGGTYNALMIVGNTNSNPNSKRTTKLYDDLIVSGNISKASGSFLIDHPLDLENKNLYHSFIEGPRADLIYRGEVTLVAGKAEVNLDTDAVDPSAQKMTVGTFSALTQNAKVYGLNNANSFTRVRSTPIVDGKFTIIAENESCTDEISWLVIAERHDAYMTHKKTNTTDDNGHLILEVEKADHDPISWQKTVETTTTNNTSDDISIPYLSVENTRLPSPGTKGYPMHPEAHGLDSLPLMKKVITITEFPETNQEL